MQCYECSAELADSSAVYRVVNRCEPFCCHGCARQFVERLRLPIGLGVGTIFVIRERNEEVAQIPRVVAIVSPSNPSGEPPLTISSREEWKAHFGQHSEPPFDFDHSPPVYIKAEPEELYVGDGYPRVRRSQP